MRIAREADSTDVKIEEQLARVTPEQWTRLLTLARSTAGGSSGKWEGGQKVGATETGAHIIEMPYFEPSETLCAFSSFLYELELVVPFDWNAWIDHRSLEEISLDSGVDAIKMLTAIIRKDRFCDGQLACCVEDGTIARIFRVLEIKHEGQTCF